MLLQIKKSKIVFVSSIMILYPVTAGAASTGKKVLAAMKKAAGFMANTVSNNGGYVYKYSEDLSQ